jgi:hypothetical protein
MTAPLHEIQTIKLDRARGKKDANATSQEEITGGVYR